ncbi:MAG TPA: hypothetical protein VMT85_00755 [Thermoanaerobaculia bacterium]|nr:hypothetical protein [Thermoanaerobaculia bacterium]
MRITKRGLMRALRAPAPAPPEDLGRKLEAGIPEDLFGSRREGDPRHEGSEPRSRRAASAARPRGHAVWAIAASVLVTVGAGWLAVRLFEERGGEVMPRAAVEEAFESQARLAPAPAEPESPSPEVDRLATVGRGASPERDATRGDPRAPASSERANDPHVSESGFVTWMAHARHELQRKRDQLRGEMERLRLQDVEVVRKSEAAPAPSRRAAAADAAPAPNSGAARGPSDAAPQDGGFIDAASHPISTLAVTSRPGSLTALLDRVEEPSRDTGSVAIEELLDEAMRDLPLEVEAIEVEGAPALVEGRVVLLLCAVVAAQGDHRLAGADGLASAIEVELDPAVASRYRLLASHAHALPPFEVGRDARGSSSQRYRVGALLEVELLRDLPAGGSLGAVRLRHDRTTERSTPPAASRAIVAGDLADGWGAARPELRLAVLASELSRIPGEATVEPPVVRSELERIRDEAGVDAVTATTAARLLALTRAEVRGEEPRPTAGDSPPAASRRPGSDD